MDGVALLREHHTREGAGKHDMAGLERDAVLSELVGKPGDAERGMAEHAGGKAGLFDLGILVHDAADPAQIDIHRSDRPPAHGDAGGGAVVGDGVDDLARIDQARIDDLHRRHHVFGGAQHVGQADARPHQPLAEDEGELHLDPRLAVIRMRHLGAVADHLVVEDIAVVRLVDHRGALHRLGGEADLVADDLAALRHLALHHLGGDGVGILDGDGGKGDVQLGRLFAILGCGHQDIGGLFAIGVGEHGLSLGRCFCWPRPAGGAPLKPADHAERHGLTQPPRR